MNKHLPTLRKTTMAFLLLFALKGNAQPTITSFTPSSGPVGTSVTITGTNFNAVPANNIVFFGSVKATVTAGTTISLTTTVPIGATYEPISVLNTGTGLTGYSSKPFIITFTNPFGTGIPSNFYKPKVDFTVGNTPRNVTIGDMDGDGKSDLVISNGNSGTISVLRNISSSGSISTSSFAPKVDFASGSFTEYVAVGDLDGDGKPDMAVATNANISVLRNTSTPGTVLFATKVDFTSASTGPVFIAIADIDLDGKPDLMTANTATGSVSVRRNLSTAGMISFATKVDFTTGSTPFSVAIGDLDGDGKPDLAVTNAAAGVNTVSILRNTSTPGIISAASFSPKVDFATGPIPRSVAIGDVDGDGKPDLVVANSGTVPLSTTLSVLHNTSTPGSITAASFAAKVDFTTGTVPRAVAIGDLDGDGKLDLVVSNTNANSISVLRNTATAGTITAGSFAAKVDFTSGLGPVSVAIGDLDGDGIPEIATANGAASSVSVFQIDLAAVPVLLSNVKAYQHNGGVQVEWTIQQEINIDRYEVERSTNGQQYTTVGIVQARGNSNLVINYKFLDPNFSKGVSYYRIKIIEAGQVTYSRVVRVNITNGLVNMITIYPNPITGNTIALQMNLQKGNYTISLTNNLGQQLYRQLIDHVGGSATENIELTKALAAGVYQLRLTGEGVNIIEQVIKK
ncbi:MAG: FG-GAP-like repeat-containing protein [Chitinophagaceae bacterium]